ncbi:MAG: hypothetical protein HYX67_03960, partial [Candidatus Melainabacteria bacterium]|nr:hypothetical protein [Candidatus Melainabacteria bacterium]
MSLEAAAAPARDTINLHGQSHSDASDNTAYKQNTPRNDLNLTNVFSEQVDSHNTGSEQSMSDQVRSTVNRFSEVLKSMQGPSSAVDRFGRDVFGIDDRSTVEKPSPASKFTPESTTEGKGVKNSAGNTWVPFNSNDPSTQDHTGNLAEKPAVAGKAKKKFAQVGIDISIPAQGELAPAAAVHAKSEVPGAVAPAAAVHAKFEVPGAVAPAAAVHAKSEVPGAVAPA